MFHSPMIESKSWSRYRKTKRREVRFELFSGKLKDGWKQNFHMKMRVEWWGGGGWELFKARRDMFKQRNLLRAMFFKIRRHFLRGRGRANGKVPEVSAASIWWSFSWKAPCVLWKLEKVSSYIPTVAFCIRFLITSLIYFKY